MGNELKERLNAKQTCDRTGTDWMKLGITYHLTSSGSPYRSASTASRSPVFRRMEAEICEYDDGFAVKTGTQMTTEQAKTFIEHYLPYKAANQVYAEGVYSVHRKPWPIEQPVLCAKYQQAREVLGLNYWQQDFEALKNSREHRNVPRRAWEKARIVRGLPI
ncbi:hypothetical protein [Vibrio alginolyticus]|uniref:hypothetical protein n=1 Tax=Vibrio alginolyticus TaxID=663 RepID=UPI0015F6D7FB|nr:hypothetical protein [Vibrio alginolyticus]